MSELNEILLGQVVMLPFYNGLRIDNCNQIPLRKSQTVEKLTSNKKLIKIHTQPKRSGLIYYLTTRFS